MAEDSDDEIAKEARRRVSRHRGPGASSVAPKVEKLLGLRPSSEAQLELLQGEDAALRELEALRCVFCRSYHGRGAWDEPEGAEAEGEGGELSDDCASESSERSPWAGGADSVEPTWRLRERMKTVSVALVLCLNIGTDPPDAVAASPRARRECWLEPFAGPSRQKALETIGAALQAQYERWQSRARYRQLLDPTADELRRLCAALRRSARGDRVLVHLNGHGVPRPTANGEVWVFNKNYTQYIPLSVYELRSVVRGPAVYVLDCGGAGVLLPHFTAPMPRHHDRNPGDKAPDDQMGGDECIVLAPCGADEALPSDPGLPADLFTACLTTPIAVALRAFGARGRRGGPPGGGDAADVPGRLGDRKTPLGELNWIFTAVTDTIAWNVLPAPLFQRLFRQDLLLASLFRNFLLAERVLKAHGCTPATVPRLPPTADHPLWAAWDLAAEGCLAQLAVGAGPSPSPAPPPAPRPEPQTAGDGAAPRTPPRDGAAAAAPAAPAAAPGAEGGDGATAYGALRGLRGLATLREETPRPLEPSPFFEEQLTAFEVWLRFGAARGALARDAPRPEQLPVVLQVLLSQAHRVRALVLLRRFLELGPRAVNLALCVGIFPYVLKLLQSPAPELRRPLVAIWAAILAFDGSCRGDLVRDGAHLYFVSHLAALDGAEPGDAAAERELDEQRALSAFVLANVCAGDRDAADACLAKRLDAILRDRLAAAAARAAARPGDRGDEGAAILRRWLGLCAAALCDGSPRARRAARRPPARGGESLLDVARRVAATDGDAAARACALAAVAALFFEAGDDVDAADDDEGRDDGADAGGAGDGAAAPTLLRDARRVARDARLAADACGRAARDASPFVRREAALAAAALAAADPRHAQGLRDAAAARRAAAAAGAAAAPPALAPKAAKLLGLAAPEGGPGDAAPRGGANAAAYDAVWGCLAALARDAFAAVARVAAPLADAVAPPVDDDDADRVGESFGDEAGARLSGDDRGAAPRGLAAAAAAARSGRGARRWAQRRFAAERRSASIAASFRGDAAPDGDAAAPAAADGAAGAAAGAGAAAAAAAAPAETLEDLLLDDPLALAGELRLYRRHRNRYRCREARAVRGRVAAALRGGAAAPPRGGAAPPRPREGRDRGLRFGELVTLENGAAEMTSLLRFHAFEPALAVVDEGDGVSVWDHEAGELRARWSNGAARLDARGRPPPAPFEGAPPPPPRPPRASPAAAAAAAAPRRGPRATCVEWLNAQSSTLLLVGSDDGAARIWGGLRLEASDDGAGGDGPRAPPRLVSAFVAAGDLETGSRSSGLVCAWAAGDASLYAGGHGPTLRRWDLGAEALAAAVATGTDACVTSLSPLEASPRVVFAGFGDGSLRLFDLRDRAAAAGSARPAAVAYPREHSAWVVHTHAHADAPRECASGCVAGDLKFWDARAPGASLRTVDVQNSTMTAFDAHGNAPLLASGSHNQFIKFMARDGDQLNIVRYHDGFLGQRIGPVSSLAFHPTKVLCAAGSTDAVVGIYAAQ